MHDRTVRRWVTALAVVALVAAIVRVSHDEFSGPTRPAPTVKSVLRAPALAAARSRRGTADAKGPESPLPRAADEAAQVHGRCVDDAGVPVADATVFAVPEGSSGESRFIDAGRAVKTGVEGAFALEIEPSAEPVVIVARHVRFRTAQESLGPRPHRDVCLVLSRGGAIHGAVATLKGAPVAGARVVARGRGADGRALETGTLSPASVQLQEALTDASGEFTLEGLDDQQYIVTLQAEGLRRVGPEFWHRAVLGRPGDRLRLVVDPVAYVHLRIRDAETNAPVPDPDFAPDVDSLRTEGFIPRTAPPAVPGDPMAPFLMGPAGAELCMFGADPDELPGRASGVVCIMGRAHDWPIAPHARLKGVLTAPGYEPATLEVPLLALAADHLPPPTEVTLRSRVGKFGRLRLRFSGGDGAVPAARRMVELQIAELGAQLARGALDAPPPAKHVTVMRSVTGESVSADEAHQLHESERQIQVWLAERAARLHVRRVEVDDAGAADFGLLPPGTYEWLPHRGVSGPPVRIEPGSEVVAEAQFVPEEGLANRTRSARGVVRMTFKDTAGRAVRGIGFGLSGADGTVPLDERGMPMAGHGGELLAPGSSLGDRPMELTIPAGEWVLHGYRPGYQDVRQRFVVNDDGRIQDLDVVIHGDGETR